MHVQLNARRIAIARLWGSPLRVRVAAPAPGAKVKEMLLRFLADEFDLPGGRVMIRRGSHGRSKIIENHGQAAGLMARGKELSHS